MSVSSDSRPHEAVDSGGLPITRDRETAIPSQPIEHDTEPEAMKLSTTAIADTVAAQEAKEAGAEDVVDIPAEVKPLDGVERVAGAVDDKAETGVDSDEFRETALVPPKHTDFASETVQVTESDSTDSTLIESEEPREDTKEAVAIASTTPSTIEAREVVGVQDTKEEEKVADGQFESAHAEGVTAQGIALSPTQESTSDAQRATGNTPATDPLTIQLDAVKPVEGVILSESFDSLSSNQAAKSSEEGPEIPIESEMTFASPVSPVSVARTVSVAGEESVPGTPISETYSDTGTRASTPGPEDGDAPRARTKAEKKRAKRLRQKQASKDAATMKAELDVAQIAVPAIPTAVGEVKEHSVPIEEQPSALARESTVETPPPVEGMPEVIKEEVVPTEEEGVKETKPNPVEIQVEETVAEPTPTISNDERKIEAAVEGHTPFLEEVPQAELPVENVPEVEAAVVEPVIEEAPKVEAVVEDTAPEIEVAPKIEPVAKEPVPVVAEALDPVAEEVAKVEEPPKNEEVKEPLRADEDIKVEEPTKVKEETEVAEEKPPKPEEEVKVEEEIKDEEPTKIEEKEPSKAEVEVKIEEPAKVQDEIKAEEPVKREEDAKAEEPVKTEEGAKVEEALRAEAPAEEPSVIEQTREASSEGLALATEEATSAGEVAIEEVPKVVSEGYHPLVEPVKEEQAVEAAPAPFAEESKDVEATDNKVHEVQPSSAQAKPEVPDDVETGFVEPLSTPALPEDAKATIPKTLEAVKEVAPAVEEVEPKAIVAATAEKLEIPAGIVEPIASPAYGEGHVEEREPIAQQLDAALEDIKVEEVAEEIVTAPEEVKQEEEPATEVSKEVESEILLPVEEEKEVEPEVTPAVETKREPVPVIEESKAEEPIEVVSEPPVVEETKETAIIEQPVVEEEVEPKEVSTDEVVKEEEPAVEASVGQPIVEKAALEVEKAAQPAVEEPIILAEEVNEVPVEPTLVVARQEVVEPAKIEEAIVPQEETSVADVEEVVEAVNAQPTETVEDVKRVAPIEEKVVEPITDAVSEIPLPTSAPQETEPEREVVGAIAHTATSTESADSPLEPITPAVVVQDLEPVQDKEAAPISQTLERPRSPFSPSFTVTTIGGSAVEAPVEENPEETAAALVADNSKQSELPPPRPWTPSYSVHSQGSPLQPKATLGDDVPAEPLSKEAPEAEQVAKDVTPEQPEVPAEALIEAAVEEPVQPTAEISTKEAEAPAVLALEEARGSVANITAPVPLIAPIPLAGSSWVPSYSVSRQGSPLPKTPQPVEKSLPLEEPAAQVPVAAESFWNGVKAVEDDSKPIHSTEIQVPKSAVLRDAPATEPTIAPATESLVPPETPPRARLESNSSTSKLLPGGWFSPRKGSHDSRPSLETASVLPPIATETLSVPSPEMGQNSASPSKKRWCTIM